MECENNIIFLLILFSLAASISTYEDLPCAAQHIPGKSVVCVCNVTYCDTITRIPLTPDAYAGYISNMNGLRFHKISGKLKDYQTELDPCPDPTFTLYPEVRYQKVEGFGSSVTDAAGIMWQSIPEPLRTQLIESYYGETGIEYSMIRTPIGGTDFSTHKYALNDHTPHDASLSNFSLAMEDYKYKIPMIKTIMEAAQEEVHIIASTWSPPPWMKSNNDYVGYSRLLPEYYQTYADYHLKYIEEYFAEGISIWAITTGNEPSTGTIGALVINCLGWNADSQATWIIDNLGPTIRQSSFKDVKILCGDDQRPTIPYWINLMFDNHPKALQYVDGIAVHFYMDYMAPQSVLTELSKRYPDKFVIGTEAAIGSTVTFGAWDQAIVYVEDIISDMNSNLVGWVDWNMCLNEVGGPNWNGNNVDSSIIVLPEKAEFVKQPMYYAMGHFSKFVPRGSRRIQVKMNDKASSIPNVAFVTPRDTVVVVLYNQASTTANFVVDGKQVTVYLEPDAIITLELPYMGWD